MRPVCLISSHFAKCYMTTGTRRETSTTNGRLNEREIGRWRGMQTQRDWNSAQLKSNALVLEYICVCVCVRNFKNKKRSSSTFLLLAKWLKPSDENSHPRKWVVVYLMPFLLQFKLLLPLWLPLLLLRLHLLFSCNFSSSLKRERAKKSLSIFHYLLLSYFYSAHLHSISLISSV